MNLREASQFVSRAAREARRITSDELPIFLTHFRSLINLWECCMLCQVECWMRSGAGRILIFVICKNYRTLAIKYILNKQTKINNGLSYSAS